MNNTDKLLRAFIEASGYEIEEVKTVTKQKFSVAKALFTERYNSQQPITTIDYKVTKKIPPTVKIQPEDMAKLISNKGAGVVVRAV